jgi:hypothetical protein
MTEEEQLKKIVDNFMQNATPAQIEEFKQILSEGNDQNNQRSSPRTNDELKDLLNRAGVGGAGAGSNKSNEQHVNNTRMNPDRLNIDPAEFAKKMSNNLQDGLGITTEGIKNTTRSVIRDMILQYDPHIEEEKLNFLIDKMSNPEQQDDGGNLPPDVIINMVNHFIKFSEGRMSESELSELPKGWEKSYWDKFPNNVKKLIADYIHQKIDKSKFWEEVISLIISK